MKEILKDIRPKVMEIFEHLHQHPEVSWKEVNTTAFIEKILKEHGCRTTTFVDCTGVVGEIGAGSPTIAVRADIDALWQEVDGVAQANHSCGHDAHMTMVLGVLFVLQGMPEKLNGTVRFIFQPAEETANGALKMIEKNVVDDVDVLYGVHVRPEQELVNGMAMPAIYNGAARFINGTITGEDSHAGRPHLGTNAVDVGAAIVQQLHGIHLDPRTPYSVKMTQFNTGSDSVNIIAGSAQFCLDLRAQTNEAMDKLIEKVENAITALATLYDRRIEMSVIGNAAAAVVHPQAEETMAEAIKAVLGEEKLSPPTVTTGGEDFHFYTLKKPHVKATMLGLGCGLTPGLHHPNMTFDRAALLTGIEILTKAVLLTLDGGHRNDSH